MKTAMILAAGRGQRLQPITNTMPKALCLVHGKPLIEHHVINLATAGFKKIIINHAHLGGEIRQHLGCGDAYGIQIIYSPEPTGALETGGAIVNAHHLLGKQPFVTVNADIFTDYDFSQLQLIPKALAHLVLVNKPEYLALGDFGLSKDNVLNTHHPKYTFSGITCYQPSLFHPRKPGRFSMTPILKQLAADQLATAEVFHGTWFDIGTPERLALANKT